MGKLFREFNDEKWEQVRTHPYFAKKIEAVAKRAEYYLEHEPPRIKFSQIHLYVTTGDRMIFQNVYSEYESRMLTFFFMYLLTKDEKYIEPLSDAIWNICDFESWSIPAHVAETLPEERRKQNLDLCSTIEGFRVAEILYFVGDKLPDLVYKRAKYEVRYRVIDSYKKYTANEFWWMRATNNWSAVCIGATLCAFLYIAEKEEIDEQIPRMIETMNCYLRGFDDEGCCLEGYAYWNYGFSHFLLFASMLRDYTDGEIDLFKNEKVHAIAKFQQNASINSTQTVSFSDGGMTFGPSAWISHYLKKEYPDIEIPSIPPSTDAACALRYVLWQDPELAVSEMKPESHIYHNAQWFIHRSNAYNLAVKAGHNNEPHNHNDVGSFIISKNGRVSFCDPGGGEYTRQYFSSERYTILACSSRGHSVPIINGKYQVTGNKKSVVHTEEKTGYGFSMDNAYDVQTLKSLTRDVDCGETCAKITDTYEFSEVPESVVERFVTFFTPHVLEDGVVKCGESVLRYDPAIFELVLGEEGVIRSSTHKDMLQFVDLKVKEPKKSMKLEVTFE